MVTTTGIIYMVIFSTFGLKGNTENIHPVRQNATAGQKGVLKCNHPFSGRENIITYWKKDNKLVCYKSASQDFNCQGYQLDASDGQSILIIPKLTTSASGQYICSLFTENTTYECAIDLLVQAEYKQVRILLNGINVNAGSTFLILLLAVAAWNFQFISL